MNEQMLKSMLLEKLANHVRTVIPIIFQKLNRHLHVAACKPGSSKCCRLLLKDAQTNIEFLVDMGADLSFIQRSEIKTKEFLRLRRNFTWNFITAKMYTSILGADFLQRYGLLVVLKNRSLIDKTTLTSQSNKLIVHS